MSRIAALAVGLAVVLLSADAHGYPQWQFSTGNTRCSNCHLSPTGGGLLSDDGREQAGEQLSSFGGDGALLHGAAGHAPDWLVLGGDMRGAFLVNDVQDPRGPSYAVFPMQAELAASVALPGGFSLAGRAGLRGQVRRPDAMIPDQNYQPITDSQLISSEHFVMWQPSSISAYIKLGRFYAPFGLRLPEHIFYVRRDLGFNLMEESYNLSAGYVAERWDLHVTAFAPDVLRHMGGTEWGGAVSFEHQILDDSAALGAQTKLASGVGVTRWITGGTAKAYVEALRTLWFGEADLIYNAFPAGVGSTVQAVAIAGGSWFPERGAVVSIYAEHEQTDVRVRNARWEAGSVELSWFPYAHVELQATGPPAAARGRRYHQDPAGAGPLLPVSAARTIVLAATLLPACAPEAPEHPTWLDVEPILRGNCTHCHGANAAAGGGIRFDLFEVDQAVCGDAALSLDAPRLARELAPLIGQDVTSPTGGRARMPPEPAPPLADWERETLVRWASAPTLGEPRGNHQPRIVLGDLPPTIDAALDLAFVVEDPDGESVVGVFRFGAQTRALDGPGAFRVKVDTASWPSGRYPRERDAV